MGHSFPVETMETIGNITEALLMDTMPLRRGGTAKPPVFDFSAGEGFAAWATFFVVSICSKFLGPYMPRCGLPMLTAYLIVGAICGPFSLDIVKAKTLPALSYINQFALAYITMSAGAELMMDELKPMIRKLMAAVLGMFTLVIAVCSIAFGMLAESPLISFLNGFDPSCQWSLAVMVGVICTTLSPATAIAVVREMKCKGLLTTTMLGITVLSDVAVLICITLSFAVGKSSCNGKPIDGAAIGIVISMIFVSIILGILLGYIFIALMKAHWLALRMLILPAGFGVFIGASYFAVGVTKSLDYKYELEIESLLICIVAGFFVVNFSDYHHRFCHVLEESGPYIFIPFFTLVGASLNLQIFVQSIGFAVILFFLRGICIFLGTFLSGRLVGQDANVNKYLWMTLMPQGGFSFGVAATISNIFPGWGESLQALIVSCVIVNQMIGPIFIKRAMAWSGDAGKLSGNEAQEEEDADPHSHLPDSELGCGDEEAGVAFGPRHSIINPITTVSIFTPMEHRHASPVEPTSMFPGVASYENQGRDNPGHSVASADGTFQVRNKVKREVSAEVLMKENEELNRTRFISMPAMSLSSS